ncbi:hypothetical protein [Paraburkholderia sp.]|uniref:hypothetical protein n=1 Tax=Paraburkholderia sp. TaxID=1926495 RepID=UPI0039E6C329
MNTVQAARNAQYIPNIDAQARSIVDCVGYATFEVDGHRERVVGQARGKSRYVPFALCR